jgi:hypothetical protein
MTDTAPDASAPPDAPAPPARSRWAGWSTRRIGIVAGVAVGVVALGIGVALAQSGSRTRTATFNLSPAGAFPGVRPVFGVRDRGPGGRPFGRFGPGFDKLAGGPDGPGGAVHSEFTVPDGSGGWRTMGMQTGTATAVSPTSITVKSADGFTKTYSVDPQTVVNAGRDGISTVKTGDTVGVRGVVANGSAKALAVQDLTTLKALRDQWGPKRPSSSSSSSTTSTTAS